MSRYLEVAGATDRADAEALVACFTEDAQVTDEGKTRRGHAAIWDWWVGPATAYNYTVRVYGTRALGEDRYVVFTRLTGNFPGGTAELANRFTLRAGLIANLEIAPPAPGEEPDGSRTR
jgi:ketosteroid isomerase-like protein